MLIRLSPTVCNLEVSAPSHRYLDLGQQVVRKTLHIHGPFLDYTQLPLPGTPATAIILPALSGSSHVSLFVPSWGIYPLPAMTPPAMPSLPTLSEELAISVFPLPLPYGACVLSSHSPMCISLPMHTNGLYMYASHVRLWDNLNTAPAQSGL